MLNWVERFNIFCFLDNHCYKSDGHQYEWLLAAGAHTVLNGDHSSLSDIDSFLSKKDWVFGHLSYDLKNRLFSGLTEKADTIGFPLFFFFQPQIIISLKDGLLQIEADDPGAIYTSISAQTQESPVKTAIPVQSGLSFEEYIQTIQALQAHIRRGDCYEINFCVAFSATAARIDPVAVYQDLVRVSPTPFSCFYKVEDSYLLCASPERFLQKRGQQLIAQPMKGTAKRNLRSAEQDQQVMETLKASPKEQSENVMIVDLMRNDLSKIGEDGSVKVTELFGVQSFPQVHQLVSSVECTLRKEILFSGIIKACFPMGSMTGAPKKRVLELIDQYETEARGIFSGSVGYFHKENFDFNVVIRSILYNRQSENLSYKVGSGITIYSDPQLEWEECLLKAAAIKKVLT
ncbi:MAG: hypothetical protein JWP88_1598 [Flaviaesturariibacter sp.]|nr:hypothetical protein [Flaviaesturariibacter sp.]